MSREPGGHIFWPKMKRTFVFILFIYEFFEIFSWQSRSSRTIDGIWTRTIHGASVADVASVAREALEQASLTSLAMLTVLRRNIASASVSLFSIALLQRSFAKCFSRRRRLRSKLGPSSSAKLSTQRHLIPLSSNKALTTSSSRLLMSRADVADERVVALEDCSVAENTDNSLNALAPSPNVNWLELSFEERLGRL